jgi:7,8-didemethyl-8-hydroxy-5-deazariboflavin synthase CofG subunit
MHGMSTTRPPSTTPQDPADGTTLNLPAYLPADLASVLDRAVAEQPLAGWEAQLLYQASARHLPVLMQLINLCRDVCGYCTFARSERDPAARVLTPEEVLSIARAGRDAGCKEALFSLGERPEERYESVRNRLKQLGFSSTVEYLAAMCKLVWDETRLLPHSNCGVLERDELLLLRDVNASMGLMLESSSERLLQKGQAHWACPGKVPEKRLETMRQASELGIAFTTGLLIGIGETDQERVDTLLTLRDCMRAHEGIQEVIVQNFRAKHDTKMRGQDEPSALDMTRTLAVARLLLGSQANLQAPPNLTPDAYGFYLHAGLTDWGGISPVTRDHINPEAAWPAITEVGEISAQAGYSLRERLALYPEYLLSRPRFVREAMRSHMLSQVDEHGLISTESSAS